MRNKGNATPRVSHLTPRISIIAAMAENRVIGVNNALPWRLPEDLKYFRRLTTGHHVIMGRRNYESIGKPLPGRTNIVVTHNPDYAAPGCHVVYSIIDALQLAKDDTEVFIIGGAQLYRQTLNRAGRMYLTLIHADITGDVLFPEFNWNEWEDVARCRHEPDDRHPYAYSFITLDKREKETKY